MRFGFAVKILGRPGLKSHDTRRWSAAADGPHLRVSIDCFREILRYLDEANIRMYRISSDFAPYVTHPDMPWFRGQIDECLDELAEVGALARGYGIRLSFHPSQYIVLNSPDEEIARHSIEDYKAQGRMLDAMGQGSEAVVVTHIGGVYGDRAGSMERFISRCERLPGETRRRLVVENDDASYSVADVLRVSRATGIPVVFDYLHHMNYNPGRLGIREAVERSLATWPSGVQPKIHFSSPRTELREQRRKSRETGKMETVYLPPLLSRHSDYVNPYEFAMFVREVEGLPEFDVMLEAKAKDLALLRLREQLVAMGLPADTEAMLSIT